MSVETALISLAVSGVLCFLILRPILAKKSDSIISDINRNDCENRNKAAKVWASKIGALYRSHPILIISACISMVIFLVFISYCRHSSPSGFVVTNYDNTLRPGGFVDDIREFFQGASFWEKQLAVAKREISMPSQALMAYEAIIKARAYVDSATSEYFNDNSEYMRFHRNERRIWKIKDAHNYGLLIELENKRRSLILSIIPEIEKRIADMRSAEESGQ